MKNEDKFDLIFRGGQREPLDFFENWFDDFMPPYPPRKDMKRFNSIMKTDVKETENNFILDVDLPGFDKKDVNLELENGYLTISAKREHKSEQTDKKENFIRRERSFGQFSRSFYVGDISQEEIEASLDNGILTIKLPKEKKQKEKSNRIEIK